MIAKRLREGKDGKGCVLHLVKYITAQHGKSHRVGEVFITNCIGETPMMAAREMLAKQMLNTRAKSDKTYHLLIAFPPGEEPRKEILQKIEAALCAKLGFAQHQRIAVVHRDTDHIHMHVAINKIHPRRLTIHNPYFDFDAPAKACAEIEEKLKLARTNHEPTGKTTGERQAKNIEVLTGQESLHTWIHREVFGKLQQAESWNALHGELAKAGLTLSLRGTGVVITSTSGHRITGSKLHRSFSKANLEKRLGPFQSKPEWCSDVKPEKEYLRAPHSPPNPLREEYEKLREARDKTKKKRLALIALECTRKKEHLLTENAVDKARARSTRTGRHGKRLLYAAIHGKYRSQLDRLFAETKRAKKDVYAECGSQTWVQWLQEQAQTERTEALEALRKRAFSLAKKNGAALRGEEAADPGVMKGEKIDGVTKRGTVIYALGADAVRDDGRSFRVGAGASPDTDIMALKLAPLRQRHPRRRRPHLSGTDDPSGSGRQSLHQICRSRHGTPAERDFPFPIPGTGGTREHCLNGHRQDGPAFAAPPSRTTHVMTDTQPRDRNRGMTSPAGEAHPDSHQRQTTPNPTAKERNMAIYDRRQSTPHTSAARRTQMGDARVAAKHPRYMATILL